MKTTTRFLVDGKPLTPEGAKSWLAANGFGKNFADDEKVIERGAAFADNVIKSSDQAKEWFLEAWRDIDWMMRGNALGIDSAPGGDTHVPETKKCVYAMAPRIVEAIMGAGSELFRVKGRDENDRKRALLIEDFLRYQLSLSQHMAGVEDRVLCGLQYGVVAVATSWDIRHGYRMVKKSRKEQAEHGVTLVIESDYKNVKEYDGLRTRLIDPRDLIWDPGAMYSSDAQFAGERMRVPLMELLAMEANGIISGVADAVEGKNETRAKGILRVETERLRIEQDKRRRDGMSLDTTGIYGKRTIDASDANRVEATMLWAPWSHVERPEKAVDWGKWQFMWVNGCPVRVARNPYDSQHIPIAFARMNKSVFSPWGISMAMDAVPLQVKYDQTRALGHRSHDLAVNPIGIHGSATDMPRSLADMLPGEWLRGQPDDFNILKMPSTIADTIAASDLFRRDIREITGVPEGFTGSDQSGTATQYEGNLTEANRRARLLTFNYADLELEVLRHAFFYSQQWTTEERKFEVLGRDATRLGFSATIKPEDLLDPVDIEIVGLSQYASHGMRANKMVQFHTQFAPFLQVALQEGKFNNDAYLRRGFQAILGHEIGSEILREDMNPQDVIPAHEENILLRQGTQLDPHPLDDDEKHTRQHVKDFDQAEKEGADEDILSGYSQHIYKHALAWRAKREQQAAQQKAKQLAMQASPATIQPDDRKEPGEGRGYQRPLDLTNGPAQTGSGTTPGPFNGARAGAPDRNQSMPQAMTA